MIIVTGGIKGGSGKTTIATHLAILRAQKGLDVLLIDADDQETSFDFSAIRSSSLTKLPEYTCIKLSGKSIRSEILKMKNKYDDIIRFCRMYKWKARNDANTALTEDKQIEIRQSKYLNNIMEQDHRLIKKRTKPMLGFKNCHSAKITINGIENIRIIRECSMNCVRVIIYSPNLIRFGK